MKYVIGAIVVFLTGFAIVAVVAQPSSSDIYDKMQSDKVRWESLTVMEKKDERLKGIEAFWLPIIENSIIEQLRDPDSYKMDDAFIEVSPYKNTAKLHIVYYARNGFGGMNKEAYTAVMKWDPVKENYELDSVETYD